MIRHIPNFITSLNLSSGFIAVIYAANGDPVTASWLLLAAMIFDFLDGFSARLLKAYSEIGKELDSLADVVSFGVAPALIIYNMLNDAFSAYGSTIALSDGLKNTLTIIVPVLMPVCAALRLAIFNTDTTQATTFKGLPTPANALAVISVVIAGHYSHSAIFNAFSGSPFFLIILTVILSLMMVSRIPLISMKFSDLKVKGNEGRYILAGLVLVSFAVFGIDAAPLIIPLYIIASLMSRLF
jgi:CDP-diacylglycerol--serine O-phosphatidyltransferase